jgi:hypothetical protein
MARARSIKPGFFKNEELAELGSDAMLLFAGLWTLADRAGRMEDRPKRIKAEVFPYHDCDVDKLLNSLVRARFIVRYSVNGSRYIAIPTWSKHQNPHVKEAASIIPAHDEHGASIMPNPEFPERAVLTPSSLTPSSLTPDPLNHGLRVQEMPKRPATAPMSQRFDEFWERHPGKKLRKDLAAGVWAHTVTIENETGVFSCLNNYLDSGEVARGAVMDPEKWLSEVVAGGCVATWPARASPVINKTKQEIQAERWDRA